MPELLEKLTTQAKQEAREALRQLVAALNGLAAVYIINEEVDVVCMWVHFCLRYIALGGLGFIVFPLTVCVCGIYDLNF